MKAIAIDDEPLALRIIQTYCQSTEGIILEKTFTQTNKALEYLSEHEVDVLFIDIQMPGILGTDFVRQLKHAPMVIFTTAYSEFAVEGFELNAIDYLLKPFTLERFRHSVNRASEYMQYIHGQKQNAKPSSVLYLKADYSLIRVILDDLQYIEAYDDYLKLYLNEQSPLVIRMTMKSILEKLPPGKFVRIHRSYIVAVDRIQKRSAGKILVSGKELPIGAMYKEALNDILEES